MADDGLLSTTHAAAATAATRRARLTVGDLITAYLQVEGVDTVFGVPGGPVMGMFDALTRAVHIRTVLCKHEQGAGSAAYGYAAASRRLGVVVVTSGPGLTNTLSALASAYQDKVPVLVLAGQVATSSIGRGAAQDSSVFGIDVLAMAKPVSALCVSAVSAQQAASLLPTLIRHALCRRQPVVLQLPADVLMSEVPHDVAVPGCYRVGATAAFDLEAATRAWSILSRAKRPALLIGSGARGTSQAVLVRMAEQLGAAAATTLRAKGTFPEDHPLSVGVFGFAGSPWAQQALLDSDVDVLLVLGSALGELASDGWNPRLQAPTVLHVDIDPAAMCTTYPAIGIVGDVAAVVSHWLLACATPAPTSPRSAWIEALKRTVARFASPEAMLESRLPLGPERLFAELSACLPLEAQLVCDIGNSMAYAAHYLELRGEQPLLIALGFACMGQASGIALGAALADPKRPVIALIGDAAFAMGGFEVHTAVEYRLLEPRAVGPVFIVLNNGGNGMVEAGVRAQFGEHSAIDTGRYRTGFDIRQIARGLGARATRVRAPGRLAPALAWALSPGAGASVIEIILSRDARPPMGSRIDTLKAFSNARELAP